MHLRISRIKTLRQNLHNCFNEMNKINENALWTALKQRLFSYGFNRITLKMIRFYQRKRTSTSNSNTHWKEHRSHSRFCRHLHTNSLLSRWLCCHGSGTDPRTDRCPLEQTAQDTREGTASRNSTGTMHTRLTVECWGESQNMARKDFSEYVKSSGQTSLKI